MIKIRSIIFLLVLILSSGCATQTLEKAEQHGRESLNAREIFDLISGNTMSLVAYDFSGNIYFDENGMLVGIDNSNQRDSGSWDINENNSLCIKFKVWYYNDLKCYLLTRDTKPNSYSFFTPNGSAYYRGTLRNGDPERLKKELKGKKSSNYLRTQFAAEKTGDFPPEQVKAGKDVTSSPQAVQGTENTGATVRQLAQNCPGCNLARADLKEARLVNANLEGADLSGANMSYANLRRARLSHANLSGARLNHANLPGADLRNCNLRNADLSGANLLLADLTGADLEGAIMTNTYTEKTKGLEK